MTNPGEDPQELLKRIQNNLGSASDSDSDSGSDSSSAEEGNLEEGGPGIQNEGEVLQSGGDDDIGEDREDNNTENIVEGDNVDDDPSKKSSEKKENEKIEIDTLSKEEEDPVPTSDNITKDIQPQDSPLDTNLELKNVESDPENIEDGNRSPEQLIDKIRKNLNSSEVDTEQESSLQDQQQPGEKSKQFQFTVVSTGVESQMVPFEESELLKQIKSQHKGKSFLTNSDISEYLIDTSTMQQSFVDLQDTLNSKVQKLKKNQKAIYKSTLMVNVMSEELLRMTDETPILITSQKSKNMMRVAETLEVDVMKSKSHLNFMVGRLEKIGKDLDLSFSSLVKKYKKYAKKQKKKQQKMEEKSLDDTESKPEQTEDIIGERSEEVLTSKQRIKKQSSKFQS